MKSVWTMVTVGLATLAIFSCGVPPAPPPPPFAPREGASEGKPPAVEAPTLVEPIRLSAPEDAPAADKFIRAWGRDQAMKMLREEESRHPGFSFELVESDIMSRVGPRYRLIAKKKAAAAVVKTD